MAQDTIQKLIGNRDAIRRIMAMEGKMDTIAKQARMNGTLSMEGEDGQASPVMKMNEQRQGEQMQINEQMLSRSKMPRQILESFRKNPGKEASTSVLGNIPDEVLEKLNRKGTVTESVQYSEPVATQHQAIDYSLLKTIINEAVQENVKKYMSALSRKLMTEGVGGNTSDLMAMKIGKSFSFITENGDIYVATLKKKGNINEDKRKRN